VKIDRAFAAQEAQRLANEIADMLAKVAGEVYAEDVVRRRYTDINGENRRFAELSGDARSSSAPAMKNRRKALSKTEKSQVEKDSYADNKLKDVGFIHPILVRWGGLFKAVKNNHKQKVANGEVTITFTLPRYAMWHEIGYDEDDDHDLPVRRPVAPNASDAKALVDGIVRRLKGRK
jgi:hypothetical protein